MIFVSVGTQDRPFNRLLEGMDRIAAALEEEVIAQTGHSTYIPEKCRHFKFCGQQEMLSYIENARIVVSQAGFGIIGNAIMLKKPLILLPREIKYGESVDKQYELAEYLDSQNESILCVRDVGLIKDAIEKLEGAQVRYDFKNNIPSIIDRFIAQKF